MSSILQDNGNLITPQLAPGAKLQYFQDGTIAGSTTHSSRLSTAGAGITIGANHPYNSNAHCSESEVTYLESNAEIFSRYIGVWSSSVQKVTSVSSVSAQQIQQCPNFSGSDGPAGALVDYALFDANGIFAGFAPDAASTGPGTAYGWPPGSGREYDGTADYRLAGVQAYYQGATTLRISYSSTDAGTVTTATDKISSVLTSLVAGQITYSYTYYAFICTSVTYEETPLGVAGAQWTISEEYLKLPRPGADENIYVTS